MPVLIEDREEKLAQVFWLREEVGSTWDVIAETVRLPVSSCRRLHHEAKGRERHTIPVPAEAREAMRDMLYADYAILLDQLRLLVLDNPMPNEKDVANFLRTLRDFTACFGLADPKPVATAMVSVDASTVYNELDHPEVLEKLKELEAFRDTLIQVVENYIPPALRQMRADHNAMHTAVLDAEFVGNEPGSSFDGPTGHSIPAPPPVSPPHLLDPNALIPPPKATGVLYAPGCEPPGYANGNGAGRYDANGLENPGA
jgi:hypothetical protein